MVGLACFQSELLPNYLFVKLTLNNRVVPSFFIILHGVMAARILFSLRDAFSEGLQLQIFTRPRGEGYVSRPQYYFYE